MLGGALSVDKYCIDAIEVWTTAEEKRKSDDCPVMYNVVSRLC